MSTELDVSFEKKDSVFKKRLQLPFLTFLLKRKENYISISTKGAFHTF